MSARFFTFVARDPNLSFAISRVSGGIVFLFGLIVFGAGMVGVVYWVINRRRATNCSTGALRE